MKNTVVLLLRTNIVCFCFSNIVSQFFVHFCKNMIKFWFRFYELLFVFEAKNVEFNNNTSKSYQNIAMRATPVDTE